MKFKIYSEEVESEKKFDKEVEDHVKKCIKHWEDVCFNGCKDIGPSDCELCKHYWDDDDSCSKCPICIYTDRHDCAGTNHSNVCNYLKRTDIEGREKFHQEALKMLKFLTDEILPFVKQDDVAYLKFLQEEDGVTIILVDESGKRILNGNIVKIVDNGTLFRYGGLNNKYFDVDEDERIKLDE